MKLFKRQRLQAAGTETTTDNEPVVDPNSLSVPERLDFLQKEIDQLQQRNFEKDRGKEFESSYTRVIFLMVVTYWTLFGYMSIIKTANPFLDAIVPTVGFNISTWSLPYVKEWWIQARHYYMHGETEATTSRRREETRHNEGLAQDQEQEGAVRQGATADIETLEEGEGSSRAK